MKSPLTPDVQFNDESNELWVFRRRASVPIELKHLSLRGEQRPRMFQDIARLRVFLP